MIYILYIKKKSMDAIKYLKLRKFAEMNTIDIFTVMHYLLR